MPRLFQVQLKVLCECGTGHPGGRKKGSGSAENREGLRRRKRCVQCVCVCVCVCVCACVCISMPVHVMAPAMRRPVCQGLWGQSSPTSVNPFNPLTHSLLLVLPGAGGRCDSMLKMACISLGLSHYQEFCKPVCKHHPGKN